MQDGRTDEGEPGLTDDQATKLHATHEKFFPQRRAAMDKGRAIHEALRGQLQPGVAANADSVRKLLDTWQQSRASMLQLDRDLDKELATYLTPVQRARMLMMREHMMGDRMRGHGEGMGDMDGPGGMHGHGHMGDPNKGDMHPPPSRPY